MPDTDGPSTPVETLIDLSREYGGVDGIPEAVLVLHGYKRVSDGYITPLEFEPKAPTIVDSLEAATSLEVKAQAAPFGTTHLEVPGSGGEPLPPDEVQIAAIAKAYDAFIDARGDLSPYWLRPTEIIDTYLPGEEHMWRFQSNFDQYYQGFSFPINEIADDVFAPFTQIAHATISELNVPEAEEYLTSEGEFYINLPPEKAVALWRQLEQWRGRLTEQRELESQYLSMLEEGLWWYNDPESKSKADFVKSLGIKTRFQLMTRTFAYYVRSLGLQQLADELSNAQDLTEFNRALEQSIKGSELKQRVFELRQELKRTSDPEARNRISAELKQAKEDLRKTTGLILGMQAYARIPELISGMYNRLIKNVQRQLPSRKAADGTINLELNSRLHPKRDLDPGRVSGDCTEGRPLPFLVPNVPTYNIKVAEDGRHIGNIYLLVTRAHGIGTVWHLDAIQIPHRYIDWKLFPDFLVAHLAEIATSQNIAAITCNTSVNGISNYDYVGKEFMDYATGRYGSDWHTIHVPPNPDPKTYSNFQTDGRVLVLWRADQRPL